MYLSTPVLAMHAAAHYIITSLFGLKQPLLSRSSDLIGENRDATRQNLLVGLLFPKTFQCAIVQTVAVAIGLLCLGLGLIGQNPSGPLTTIDFTTTNLAGAFFIIISCSLGAKLMSTSIILAAHIHSRTRALLALGVCGCCCAGLYAYGWGGLVLGSLPCYFGDAAAPQGYVSGGSATGGMIGCQGITSFSVFFGVIYTLVFLPMAVVCILAAYHVARNSSKSRSQRLPHHSSSSASPQIVSVSELHAPKHRSLVIGIISVVFFLLCMSCTTFLTWQFAVYAANGYQLPGTGWPVNTNYTNNYFQGNYDPLNFALYKWNPSGPVIVQLWPDVVVYTAFMIVLFIFGFVARLSVTVSAVLRKNIMLPVVGPVCCGTLLLLFWAAALFGTWAFYWSVLYCDSDCMADIGKSRFQCCRMFQETRKCTRIMPDPAYGCGTAEQRANAAFYGVTSSDISNCTGTSQCVPYGKTLFPVENWQLHVAARTVGHCAYLLMSLLMYPVSKQSAFAHLYGVHFPRVLAFHRYVGTAVFLVVALHALLWYIIWLGDGTLLDNVFASEFLKISPACPHRDQFTIPIMETLWLLMLISLIFAVLYRRRTGMYHIFRQTHLIGPVFVAAAAYHAFASWYYIAPPALLWLFDRMIRLYRAATSLSPNRVAREGVGQEGTVAVIQFPAVAHEAGQYGYLVCPQISPDNWHPFTIASAPCDAVTTVVVKDMGVGSWTRQLHEYIAKCELEGTLPELWLDAAYGGMCNLSQASDIILVAGGIGITPILSLLRQLCHIYDGRSSTESSALHNSPKLPPITLIWSVRQGFLVSLFCDQLTEVLHKHFPLSPISIKVYYTAPKGDLPPEVSLKLNSVISLGGRPDICDIFSAVKTRSSLSRDVDLSAVHAIACGPEALISSVQSSCITNGFTFFSEDFYF